MIKIIIGITLLTCSFFSYAFNIYSTGGSIETCIKSPSGKNICLARAANFGQKICCR